MRLRIVTVIGLSMLLGLGRSAFAAPDEDVAINARVFNGYTRTKLPNGTWRPEYYGFGEGGRWDGVKVDSSLDRISFLTVAKTIAEPLRAQGYLPSTDPKHTDLLILVFWGVTTGAEGGEYDHGLTGLTDAMNTMANTPADSPLASSANDALGTALALQSMENRARERNNFQNAGILGYTRAYEHALDMRQIGISAGEDAIWELEANRYFVVLKAYDFPYAVKEKKLRLLWEVRFSIYERGNKFDAQLLAMTRAAAKYFGQDTKGLVRREVPEGTVNVGTPTVVEGPTPTVKPR